MRIFTALIALTFAVTAYAVKPGDPPTDPGTD
jgi:hypothetical protein